MATPRWGYDPKAKRYRDLQSGRFLPNRTVSSLRDRVITSAAREARSLAKLAANGDITQAAFKSGMRDLLRNVHGSEAIFGRGGVNAMTSADWGRVGSTLKQQYAYLDKFAAEIGEISGPTEAQAMARAELYVGAAVKSYEQGRAAAFGIAGKLPRYPGDNCIGLGNCRCAWDIQEDDENIDCYWRLGGDDACEPCQGNAADYNPFRIVKPKTVEEVRRVRLAPIVRIGGVAA